MIDGRKNLPGPYDARPALSAFPYIAQRGAASAQGVVQTCLLRLPQPIFMPVTILRLPPGGRCAGQNKSFITASNRKVHDAHDRREIEKRTRSSLLGRLPPLHSRPGQDGRSVAGCKQKEVAPVVRRERDAEGPSSGLCRRGLFHDSRCESADQPPLLGAFSGRLLERMPHAAGSTSRPAHDVRALKKRSRTCNGGRHRSSWYRSGAQALPATKRPRSANRPGRRRCPAGFSGQHQLGKLRTSLSVAEVEAPCGRRVPPATASSLVRGGGRMPSRQSRTPAASDAFDAPGTDPIARRPPSPGTDPIARRPPSPGGFTDRRRRARDSFAASRACRLRQ